MKYADHVIAGRRIPVTYYDQPEESGLSSVILKSLGELKVENVLPNVSYFIFISYCMFHISFLTHAQAALDACLISAQVNIPKNLPPPFFQSLI